MANDNEAILGGSNAGDTESTDGEWPPKDLLAAIDSIAQPASAQPAPANSAPPAQGVEPAPAGPNLTDLRAAAPGRDERYAAIERWKEKREEEGRAKRERRAAGRENYLERTYRAPAREAYRTEKALEGKTVRPYKWHDHAVPDHAEGGYQRVLRMHRDRQRSYRGKTAETTRSYTDLSEYTEEQKAEHRRALARERQRRKRQMEKIDAALADLDLGDPSEWEWDPNLVDLDE